MAQYSVQLYTVMHVNDTKANLGQNLIKIKPEIKIPEKCPKNYPKNGPNLDKNVLYPGFGNTV